MRHVKKMERVSQMVDSEDVDVIPLNQSDVIFVSTVVTFLALLKAGERDIEKIKKEISQNGKLVDYLQKYEEGVIAGHILMYKLMYKQITK